MKIEDRISHLSNAAHAPLPDPITAIVTHSKKVTAGSVFVALKGQRTDGHLHLKEAIQRGAAALVIEDKKHLKNLNFKGPICITQNTKETLALLLNEFYDFPSHKMFCIGVTGTNGKTTVSHLLAFLFSSLGWKVGLIGTLAQSIVAVQNKQNNMHLRLPGKGDISESSLAHKSGTLAHLTTPSATELYSLLNTFYQNETQVAVMEASSIGLDQHRVAGVDFNLAIWTNLSQDHLDYHPNMEAYFQSKKILFTGESPLTFSEQNTSTNDYANYKDATKKNFMAIINFDDPYGLKLASTIKTKYLSYGKKNASFTWKILSSDLSGTKFQLSYPAQFASNIKENKNTSLNIVEVHSPLLGEYNVSNAVAAIAAASATGFPIEKSIKALSLFQGIQGRMERVPSPNPNSYIFIDYAHSPDALKQVLAFLKQHKKNKQLICVFGCGGDRDKQKRPLMGAIAEKYSDKIILTSDNPRTEDPKNIIHDILKGFQCRDKVSIEPDRKLAIHKALKYYKNNTILIAGKGHEQHQIIKTKRNALDERRVIKNFFQAN